MWRMDMFLPILAVFCISQVTMATLLVKTPCGKIQGREATSVKKQSYVAFTNIPYAKPPVGELRFAKPQPYPKTDGILDASKEKITICPQPVDQRIVEDSSLLVGGVEDCLILNVYVPKLDSEKRKVMVFIHGGGFVMGGSDFYVPGTFVIEQDIIMVTINYRLGILGFLSTEDEAIPGNFGLWDQTMALKWVKDNIAAFGGDAEDIAIAGQSAGSSSVTFHCISPHSIGLFTKAFAQGGLSTSVFAKSLQSRADAMSVAIDTKCWDGEPSENLTLEQSQGIVDCLRKLHVKDVTKSTDFSMNTAKFAPRMDGDFVPRQDLQLLQDDAYLESVAFFDRKYMFALDNNERGLFENILDATEEHIMGQNESSSQDSEALRDQYLESVWTFYINTRLEPKSPTNYAVSKIKQWYHNRFTKPLHEMVSDLGFLIPTYDYLETLSRSKDTGVWLLHFNHYPSYMKGKLRGIPHPLDLMYWFDISVTKVEKYFHVGAQGEFDEEDLKVKDMFSSVIGDFVRSGDPSRALRDQLPPGWPTFDMQGSHYLDFSPEPRVKSHLDEEKRTLWLKKVPEWMSRDQETKDVKRDEL